MGKKHKPKKHKSKGYDEEYEEEREGGGEVGSLKLVLKVGGGDEKKHKHKKKKKKKDKERHRHTEDESVKEETEENNDEEEDFSVSQEEDEDTYEPPAKRALLDLDDELGEESNSSQDIQPPRRSVRQVVEVKEDTKGVLRECLLYIQKYLQRKDFNGFFAYPVNDVIAPGYSSIIKDPMDFSTMLSKIENDLYNSIMDYKNDYVLMCNNAMTYNRPETIYYKEAKKLLQSGMKMMSKEKLLTMRGSLGFMSSITMEEIGLNQEDQSVAVLEELNAKEKEYEITAKNRDNIGRYEAFPDNMTPDEIIAQAQSAALEARDILSWKKPKTKLSFLRKRDDGTTSLTVINSDNDGIVGENEKIISLGALTGKLQTGTGSIAGFKEDKRNRANQINYLTYGPFSSHAPTYDTSFSNISKEESDLLLSTYGDESGVQYAQSVMKFVEDAEEDCTRIVDSLLDVLTKGQHTISMKQIQQKRAEDKEQLEKIAQRMGSVESSQDTDTTSNVSEDIKVKTEIQGRLDKTAELLQELHHTQSERLSLKPPPHLGHIQGVGEKEAQLAEKVTSELTSLTKDTVPQNVTSLRGIRKAMGISVEPVQGTDESQPIEIEDQEESSQLNEVIQIDSNVVDSMLQKNEDNFIDNELLMETNDTVIDNL
ncbi:Bromodomain containing protein 7 [Mactra antiquata]